MEEPLALSVVYVVWFAVAPVLVTGVAARLYRFRREWQVLTLSYLFNAIVLVILGFVLFDWMINVRTHSIGDEVIPPKSYAFDIVMFGAMALVPLLVTIAHIRDAHGGRRYP